MEALKAIIDFVLHIDRSLFWLTQTYGTAVYAILFIIVFAETGFIVTPFLPGDSLLFAAGSLSALGAMNIWIVIAILISAAFLGDTANYWIGRKIGPQLFDKDRRFLKRAHYEKAHAFYEKYGGVAIILARFVPIVRTFAPCVAGISQMHYPMFMLYNLVGGVIWVLTFTLAGYFFGQIPVVKENFELAMVAIVAISVLPIVYEVLKHKMSEKK